MLLQALFTSMLLSPTPPHPWIKPLLVPRRRPLCRSLQTAAPSCCRCCTSSAASWLSCASRQRPAWLRAGSRTRRWAAPTRVSTSVRHMCRVQPGCRMPQATPMHGHVHAQHRAYGQGARGMMHVPPVARWHAPCIMAVGMLNLQLSCTGFVCGLPACLPQHLNHLLRHESHHAVCLDPQPTTNNNAGLFNPSRHADAGCRRWPAV